MITSSISIDEKNYCPLVETTATIPTCDSIIQTSQTTDVSTPFNIDVQVQHINLMLMCIVIPSYCCIVNMQDVIN